VGGDPWEHGRGKARGVRVGVGMRVKCEMGAARSRVWGATLAAWEGQGVKLGGVRDRALQGDEVRRTTWSAGAGARVGPESKATKQQSNVGAWEPQGVGARAVDVDACRAYSSMGQRGERPPAPRPPPVPLASGRGLAQGAWISGIHKTQFQARLF